VLDKSPEVDLLVGLGCAKRLDDEVRRERDGGADQAALS